MPALAPRLSLALSTLRVAPWIPALVLLIGMPARSRAAEPPATDLLETVIAGIHSNFAQLRSGKATIIHRLEDPRANRSPKIDAAQQFESKCIVLFRDSDLRIEFSGADKSAVGPKNVIVVLDGVATQYAPEKKLGWIRSSAKLSNSQELDPRAFGTRQALETYQEFLREGDIVSSSLAPTGGNSEIELRLRKPTGRIVSLRFDPKHNNLPSMIAYHFPDGSINAVTRFEYQQPLLNVWFLKTAVKCIYPKPGLALTPDSSRWSQRQTTTVLELSQVNEPIDTDIFKLAIADGTRLTDVLHGKISTVGDLPETPIRETPGIKTGGWLLCINVGILGLLTAFILKKRRTTKFEGRASPTSSNS